MRAGLEKGVTLFFHRENDAVLLMITNAMSPKTPTWSPEPEVLIVLLFSGVVLHAQPCPPPPPPTAPARSG